MSDQTNPHFNQIYWFCMLTLILGFGYIIAVTFISVPETNQRVVDTATGFVLGSMIMSAIGYLLGGNPVQVPKKTDNISTDKMQVDADNVNVNENK